ncbi:MAG: tetratricopeptide repeat protein [Chthoniobacterales bacterium]
MGICLVLVAAVWIVFGQTARYGFINYDDGYYVYQNPSISNGLTCAGLIKAFTRPLVGNWHPLTSLSLMLDAQFVGLNPGGYHCVNVLLHSIGVLLLFLVLRAMTGAVWRSAFVAALFAIHPLRAESVVWISERKDVLSGVFFMLTLAAYYRYVSKPPLLSSYALVIVAFCAGLLAKAMLVTLPFLLLLLDYWPLGRFEPVSELSTSDEEGRKKSFSWLVLEKIPLLILAAAVSVGTVLAQEPALKAAATWPLLLRVENALVTIWIYLRQMVWPADLAIFYPHPKGNLPLWIVALALVGLLGVTAGVAGLRKRYPYLVTGWFWYLGMLVPVLGLVQVGWQAHADRYTYLPQIGIYLILSWGGADLAAGCPRRRLILSGAATLIISALMVLAWRQVGYWSSPVYLWRHTLAVTTNNDVAERGLGAALIKLGLVDEAIAHDRAALRIRPGDANGLTNLAGALFEKGELPEAIQYFREVARLRPNDSEIRCNLGKALFRTGALDESVSEFREALRLRPGDSDTACSLGNALLEKGDAGAAIPYFRRALGLSPNNLAAHYNLAIALRRNGQLDAAIAEFRQTLRLDPRKVDTHNNLAIALLKKGLTNEAFAEWQTALQIQPGNAEMHDNLGRALLGQGRIAEAMAEWRETLRLEPNKAATEISLAWILATAPEAELRDGKSALQLAQLSFRAAADRNLMTYRVVAAAYAERGQFQAAIRVAQEGAERADAEGQPSIARLLQLDLSLYQQGVPLRDSTYGRGAR